MRLALAALLCVGAISYTAVSTPMRRAKPTPPLGLSARIEGRTLVVAVAPRAASEVSLSAAGRRLRLDLARGECRESRIDLENPAEEVVVSASAVIDGIPVTRAVTLNPRPARDTGRALVNSRGEAIVEHVVER